MEFITKFKIFESFDSYNTKVNLINSLDQDIIDEFWEEYCSRDVEEIIELWPNCVFRHIDDERFVQDWIDNDINQLTIDDYDDKDDFVKYLENNMDDDKEVIVLKKYNKKNPEDTYEQYHNFMLEDLSRKQLRKIIEKSNEEDDYVAFIVNDRYDDYDAETLIDELYGKDYDKMYDVVRNYIDDDEIIKEYEQEADKPDDLANILQHKSDIQEKILEVDPYYALDIAQIVVEEEDDNDNICDQYDFQIAYIESYYKKNSDDPNSRADAIKYLYDHFDLDSDIEEKYPDDMWKVEGDTFNI